MYLWLQGYNKNGEITKKILDQFLGSLRLETQGPISCEEDQVLG